MPSWTDTLAARADGLVPYHQGADESTEAYKARMAAWQAERAAKAAPAPAPAPAPAAPVVPIAPGT